MKSSVLSSTFCIVLGLVVFPLSSADASSTSADSVHFCVPFDYEQWRREHPLPAAKVAADLNVGAPRTIRAIYFLPNDRPFRQEVVDSIKVRIRQSQTFFVEQMQARGYGSVTLRIETDARGEPFVNHVNGQHPDSHYLDNTHVVYDEIEQIFDLQENIYLVVVDHSINAIGLGGGRRAGGTGGGYKKRGSALVPSSVIFTTVAHELGHAFGLLHDFRDDEYIMSYGGRERSSLSACAAEFLTAHPYFNDESSLESDWQRSPRVELISARGYAAGATSVPIQLSVNDSRALHQVILFAVTRDIGITAGGSEIKACRALSGGRDAVVEFDYDGSIPSSFVSSLADPVAHPIRVKVVNSDGDVGNTDFVVSEISPHQIATQEGVDREVNSVVFSPNGAILATGSWDGMITLWNLETNTQIADLRGHTDGVNSVVFSPNGVNLASGSWDRTIRVWDLTTMNEVSILKGHEDGVMSVALTARDDDLVLASGSRDGAVKLWDVGTREVIATLKGHTGEVTSVSFSPDGAFLASAGGRGDLAVKLWDVGARQPVGTLEGHTSGVTAVAFSPDGGTVASGSRDRTVILWDMATRRRIGTLEGHASGVNSLSLSAPDGALLATGSWDGTVILWDVLTRGKITVFGHTSGVRSVSLSPGGTTLAGAARDGTIRLWDVSKWMGPRPFALEIISGDGQKGVPGAALAKPLVVEVRDQFGDPLPDAVVTFTVTVGEGKLSSRFALAHVTTDANGRAELPLTLGLHPGPNTVSVSIGGRALVAFRAEGVGTAVAELEGDYRTWQLPKAATVRLGKGTMGEGDRAVALSPDGQCLAVASAIGVWLYESATSRALALLSTESPVHSVAFSLDGTLASGLDNGMVELWDVETGKTVGALRHADWGRVTAVVFSPDGTRLASGSRDQVIKLWNVETRREIGTWEVPREENSVQSLSVDFSPDGTRLASGFQDGTVRLWAVSTQSEVAALEGHADRVTSVSFSPDGRLLASSGGWNDPTVRLWDAARQTEVATLRGHRNEVRSVAFSRPEGGTLASAGGRLDPTVRLWDVATRVPINTLEEHTGSVHSVTYSRDGGTLASGAADGRVLLRDLDSRNAIGLSGHESLSSMALSPDGVLLATGRPDGTLLLRYTVTQTQIAVLDGHKGGIAAMAFSSDAITLASAGGWQDKTVRLWDVRTQELVGTLEGHSGGITSVTFSPNGTLLASAGGWSDASVKLWDIGTQELIGTLEGHTDRVTSVSFSADGALLASAGGHEDKTIKLWDVKTGDQIATLEGHTGSVNDVAFAPEGAILASGARDGIKLWDTGTRQPIGALEGPGGNTVSFSRDGTMLASGSWRGVTLWDVATGSMITTLEGHARSVNHVVLSPDRMNLVSGSDDGTILLWDVSEWTGPRPSAMRIISGDGQQGAPGATLASPLVVEVRDQFGNILPGTRVTFTVIEGEGRLSGRYNIQHITTNANGRAEVLLTLGPSRGPNAVVVSVDDRKLATFTAKGVGSTIVELEGDYRTWHLPTAATLRLGKGSIGEGDRAVALSPDGRCLAVASAIGVWLYEASTSRTLALLPTPNSVNSVAFAPDGILAAGVDNGRVQLWEVETGERIGTLRHADWGGVTSVMFSPDGSGLASGSWDQVIKLWDLETRREIATWQVPREDDNGLSLSVVYSPDGTTLASGFLDGTVRLWDVSTQMEIATLEGHTDWVASVSFSPDGSLLASAGGGWDDRTVRLWDMATQTEVATLRGHTAGVRSVAFSSPDGDTLASGSWDHTVRLWDVTENEEVAALEEHAGAVVSVVYSPDGAILISGDDDGRVLLRDVRSGNSVGLSGHGSLSAMALSRDGVALALGHRDGTIYLWDAASNTRIATLEGHTSGIGAVAFSSDGALLASGSWDRTIRLWDMKTRELVETLEGHTGGVTSVSFSLDGATLASAGGWNDATVRLWDLASREPIGTLEGHTNEVRSVSFSSDGARLASGGGYEDKTVRIWNVATKELIGILEGHTGSVRAVAFSPDDALLASGSRDGVTLWDAGTRQRRSSLNNRGSANSLAFSADGAMLVSGSWYGARLWDVETREQIANLEGHTGWVHSVAFSDDGDVLATGASDGTMLLWNIAEYLAPSIPSPDFDGDGMVGFPDFLQFAAQFGLSQGAEGYDARFDLDGNGAIGFSDFLIFAGAFGKSTV
ncbi:MAG: hypothetical protein OYM47_12205 [Gemmatimonadota bacterium]|nr:hypothetical protein [Gemmatimonadota bacterium]